MKFYTVIFFSLFFLNANSMADSETSKENKIDAKQAKLILDEINNTQYKQLNITKAAKDSPKMRYKYHSYIVGDFNNDNIKDIAICSKVGGGIEWRSYSHVAQYVNGEWKLVYRGSCGGGRAQLGRGA